MKVSVFPRGNKLYIRHTIPGTNKQVRIPTGFDNDAYGKEQAEIKAQEIRLSMLRKEHRIKDSRLYFSEGYEVFIENRQKKTNHTSNYELLKNLVLKQPDKPIRNYDENFFLDLKNELLKTLAHNTVSTYLSHAKTIFAFFLKKNWTNENPVPDMPPMDMPIIIITNVHLKQIFNYAKKNDIEYYKYIKHLYLSGFRREEACKLKREQLYFDRRKINIFNSKKNRWELFPMIRGLDKFLLQYRSMAPEDKLFNLSPDKASKKFNEIILELKLPKYTLHDLRRKFGTEEANNYMPAQLMKLMRHKDIRTTMKFYVEAELDDLTDKNKKPGVDV